MIIKIPKNPAIVLIVVGFLIGASLLGTRSSTPTKTQQPLEGEIKEIQVTAQQFDFIPNLIRVTLGDNVVLKITSVDVAHGFSLPEFGINETLNPGETVTVEFQATKRGEFEFWCSVVCGSGHSGMRGRLIVE